MKVSRRSVLSSVAAFAILPISAEAKCSTLFRNNNTIRGFSQLKLGAGGMLTSLSIGADGTTIARTDTYGAWIGSPRTAGWNQAVTSTSLTSGTGSYVPVEAVVAPSNSAIMYMLLSDGFLYKTTNRGELWSQVTELKNTQFNGGNIALPNKQWASYIAIDPANPDIVIVGAPSTTILPTNPTATSSRVIYATSSNLGYVSVGDTVINSTTNQTIGMIEYINASKRSITLNANAAAAVSIGDVLKILHNGGLHYTQNGGRTWNWISTSSVPGDSAPNALNTPNSTPGYTGGYLIAFDATTTLGASTPGIYITSFGQGVFHTAGGVTGVWTKLTGSGGKMPTTFTNAVVDQFGNLWIIDGSGPGSGSGALHVYPHSGTVIFDPEQWIAPRTGGGDKLQGVAIDPGQNVETRSRIYVAGANTAGLLTSQNGGIAWVSCAYPTLKGPSNGIKWIFNYGAQPFGAGNHFYAGGMIKIVFDPSRSNKLCATSGVDFWTCTPPKDGITNWAWNDEGGQGTGLTGIEQLVVNQIISPWTSGSVPMAVCWDRPIFQISPASYPDAYGPAVPNPFSAPPQGFSADWASSTPSTITLVTNGTGDTSPSVSSDGGRSWSRWPGLPTERVFGGSIAASSTLNWCWFPSNNNNPQYTADGGATWNSLGTYFKTNFDVPNDGTENGWGYAYFNDYQIVCSDRVNPNIFYAWNYGGPRGKQGSYVGIYVSTNGGQTWKRFNPRFAYGNGGINVMLRSVPNKAGHVFINFGGPYNAGYPTYWTINGGSTWTAIPKVTDVVAYGFGAQAPGGNGYPTLYIYGKFGGVRGLWQGTSFNSSTGTADWISLGTYPLNSLDTVKWIEGDANIYGRVYIGFAGSGAASYSAA